MQSHPPPPDPPAESPNRPLRFLAALALLAALYLARDILIPAALAVLLTFLLHPLVGYFKRRFRIPHAAAAVVTLLLAGVSFAGVAAVVGYQVVDLTHRLPDYEENLRDKARSLRGSSEGTFSRISGTVKDLRDELVATTQPTTAPTTAAARIGPDAPDAPIARVPDEKPLAVRIVEPDTDTFSVLAGVAQPMLFPIVESAIVVLLLIFLLLYSDDVRERMIWIAGKRQISLTTAALDEIGRRIGAYLRAQLIVNLCYGTMVATGLLLLGVPNALLWGLMAVALRFIPYLGPWLAAILPTLLAIAVFPGWTRPMMVIAMFAVVELITNMVLEPWLYSGSSGLSPLGVVLAAVFWAWLWGPLALLLAVPITVCLVVIGKHVPQLSAFHHLLGSDRVIPASGRLYQRLLVGDEVTAAQIISEQLDQRPFVEVCDDVIVPVLQDFKGDYAGGAITPGQFYRGLRMLDRLCVPDERPDAAAPCRDSAPMLCIAVQNEADDLAATLLARAAEGPGVRVQQAGSHTLAGEIAQRIAESNPATVVVVQVAPISAAHTRHVIKAIARATSGQENRLIELSLGDRSAGPGSEAAETAGNHRREHRLSATLARVCELHQVRRDSRQAAEPSARAPAPADADAVASSSPH